MATSTIDNIGRTARAILVAALLPGLAAFAQKPIEIDVVAPFGSPPVTPNISELNLKSSKHVFLVKIPPGSPVIGGGLALDKAGNIYLSHHGSTPGSGTVLLLAGDGRAPFSFIRGLDRPSDIELSADGRAIVIAQPDGQVVRKYLGVSVRPLHDTGVPVTAMAFLITDMDRYSAPLSSDGYFHFLDIFKPGQESKTFNLFIQYNEIQWEFYELFFTTVDGEYAGQTVMDLPF